MPEEWDWIQLTSEEWLKGELKVMYNDRLEFESDELDLLTFDWEDIQQVRTAQTLQIRFPGDVEATGRLYINGEIVRVIGETEQEYARSGIVSIAPGSPREIDYWSGKISLGANAREGNTNVVEVNSSAKIQRRTVHSRLVFDYMGNFNRTEDVNVADNHRVSGGWDKFVTDRFYWTVVFAEYFRDRFQNIAHQGTLGAGVGYTLRDTARTDWSAGGGPAVQYREFDSVEEGAPDSETTPALVASTDYDLEMAKWLDYNFSYRFQITSKEAGRYNHHLVTGFETEVTSLIDFDITFVWDRIEYPQPDEEGNIPQSDDFRLIVALGLEW
jgi:putative salt-induced outer membrane protein YdiY